MDRLISLQAAISLPVKPKEDRYFQTYNLDDAFDYGWYSLQECIRKLPSAEPERKKGFWYALEKGDKGYSASDFKCSVCGEPNHTWLTKPNYCPNCGAKMED